MNYLISTNDNIIKLKLKGNVTDEELIFALKEFANKINEENYLVGIVDGKGLTNVLELSAKYSIISTLERLGFSRNCRFYISSNSQIEERKIIENIAFNRGWRLYLFDNTEEAVHCAEKFLLQNSKVV
ncbi:hypothetical protein [Flammeovirga pacifica]|uniref:STAS/SEC14 domain-containing protein n=1 Tax=Flammeovirga pacifica TaxID=915059 RepID=A0A1S1YSU1_FLAPC|nr:hypothetical protein [Flammeovirga pacifica]OHX64090.1 hypothetical protein NH26_21015 [Flammeovirga pacifica]